MGIVSIQNCKTIGVEYQIGSSTEDILEGDLGIWESGLRGGGGAQQTLHQQFPTQWMSYRRVQVTKGAGRLVWSQKWSLSQVNFMLLTKQAAVLPLALGWAQTAVFGLDSQWCDPWWYGGRHRLAACNIWFEFGAEFEDKRGRGFEWFKSHKAPSVEKRVKH